MKEALLCMEESLSEEAKETVAYVKLTELLASMGWMPPEDEPESLPP